MTDLRPTIVPKSDQLNADDLIASTMTITVDRVALSGSAEQPIVIHYKGENGRPYKPCKSMRRVMVHIWGPDGAAYAGRRMTLYRDPAVTFGGAQVGGIRISHMSDMDGDREVPLMVTKGQRRPYKVRPLAAERPALAAPRDGAVNDPADYAAALEATISSALDPDELGTAMNAEFGRGEWKRFKAANPDRAKTIRQSAMDKIEALRNEDALP